MLNNVRRALFCCCITLAVQNSISAWDFWPFKRNAIAAPSVKIAPVSDGNFIYFQYGGNSTIQPYINSINKFLNAYDETNQAGDVRLCEFNNPHDEGAVCVFDKVNLHVCSQQDDFGYYEGSPCVYFTLSQVLDWIPYPLNGSDIQKPPSDAFSKMPKHLVDSIVNNEIQKPLEKYIWLTCDGDTAADKEFVGPISYYPRNGFPTYYFPFKNTEGYQSPIVAVHFERPTRAFAITVVCKAWAKNIVLDEDNGLGFVKFVLLID
ncbi:sodium/potassium-transporting ATPase subunit beta-2-like [Bradysia coprophila]|uniref:sodium/potassium-transporting ATPase subunit beta-2-like n=1 Tax=Bradysia coprophila TaxID=38358 RepID=UPI00187DC391|nr:sodium/potassium-transporting ATPase subunit beta-2-like [Bradysia coprophila]